MNMNIDKKQSIPPVECAGTSFWVPLTELTQKNKEQWLAQIRTQCETENFRDFCRRSLERPTFDWHDPKTDLLDRFCRALKSAPDGSCLSAVFHGTPTFNVKNILAKGLDPNKRRGQAHGPGEYFGKDPGTATSYCRGGKQMCVFLVVVPKGKPKPQGGSAGTPLLARLGHNKPFEFVVVETNHHQLPVGVLKFSSVKAAALNASYELKRQLQQLNQEALEAEKQAQVAAAKAKIIQLIIHRELESAGTLYNRNKGDFDEVSKKEIGIYAHEVYDEEFISYYFAGGLPKPKQGHANEEFRFAKTCTVEELEEKSKEAQAKLDTASKATPEAAALMAQERKAPRLGESHSPGRAAGRRQHTENSKNANNE